MIVGNIQLKSGLRAIQWDGKNYNEIVEALIYHSSFSQRLSTWYIKPEIGHDLNLEMGDILVFRDIERKRFMQAYSLEIFHELFFSDPLFKKERC